MSPNMVAFVNKLFELNNIWQFTDYHVMFKNKMIANLAFGVRAIYLLFSLLSRNRVILCVILSIQSHHFRAHRWGNNGNSQRLYFLGLKSTADGDCSHEIKRHLLPGRKAMTNLDSILTSRDITLPTKVCLVKSMVFTVVMYGYGSWTIKKAEHLRIDAL